MAINFSARRDGQVLTADDGQVLVFSDGKKTWHEIRGSQHQSYTVKDSESLRSVGRFCPERKELDLYEEAVITVDKDRGVASPVSPIEGDPFISLESALSWVSSNKRLSGLEVKIKVGKGRNVFSSALNIDLSHLSKLTLTSAEDTEQFNYANSVSALMTGLNSVTTQAQTAIHTNALTHIGNSLYGQFDSWVLIETEAKLTISNLRFLEIKSIAFRREVYTAPSTNQMFLELINCSGVCFRDMIVTETSTKRFVSLSRCGAVRFLSTLWANTASRATTPVAMTLSCDQLTIKNSIILNYPLTLSRCGGLTINTAKVIAHSPTAISILNSPFLLNAVEFAGNTGAVGLKTISSVGTMTSCVMTGSGSLTAQTALETSNVVMRNCELKAASLALIVDEGTCYMEACNITDNGPYFSVGSGIYARACCLTVSGCFLNNNNVAAIEPKISRIAAYSNTGNNSSGTTFARGFSASTGIFGQLGMLHNGI